MAVRWRIGIFFAALALLVVVGVVVQTIVRTDSSPAARDSSAPQLIHVRADSGACGIGWRATLAGTQDFDVENTSTQGMEVYLEDARTRAIYLDLESIGVGASASGQVRLGDGTYRFVCLPADADPSLGARVRLTGAPGAGGLTPGVAPVTNNDLITAAKSYTAWVAGRLPILQAQSVQLAAAVTSGNRAHAESAWLAAHETYETLGAAYDAFGDYDAEINGSPANGQTALADPSLTGFHKIEAMLWSGAALPAVEPYTNGLVTNVTALRGWFADAEITPLNMGVRAHEILENALEFELTGADDAGSGTTLATVAANITGTDEALAPLRPILATRDTALAETETWLNRTQTLIESYRSADGSWKPLEDLTTLQREQVDADVDQTLELLSRVAAICDPRRAA